MVGIAGSGMSALARLFVEMGVSVSGSDCGGSARLQALRNIGVKVYENHAAENLENPDLVVFSPAVTRDNVELCYARQHGIRLCSRGSALADLLRVRDYVSVAGSHGKTTISAMLTTIFDRAGLSPGFMLGAAMPNFDNKNARWNEGSIFVAETCEAFRALDYFSPTHCIVTNIDDEHSEQYGGYKQLESAFEAFIDRAFTAGCVVLCGEDLKLTKLSEKIGQRAILYGFKKNATWRADNVELKNNASVFTAIHKDGHSVSLQLSVPGNHNVLNALGALAMAHAHGVPLEIIAEALERFQPVERRWQQIGCSNDIEIFDDFAHHPTEIAATLAMARLSAGAEGRVIALIEPLMHARVNRLAQEFATSLADSDECIVLPVNGSAEPQTIEPSDPLLHDALRRQNCSFHLCNDVNQAASIMASLARKGDVVVTMGADKASLCAQAALVALNKTKEEGSTQAMSLIEPIKVEGIPSDQERLQSRFEQVVLTKPNATCVVEGDQVWTYRAISTMADQVANQLIHRGLGPEDLIALRLKKSPYLIALIIGVLKAGCAFIPIDPHMQRVGIRNSLLRVGVKFAITDEEDSSSSNLGIPSINIKQFFGSAPSSLPVQCMAMRSNLAYAIFTSGSTGEPKLVGVEHRNVVNVIEHSVQELTEQQDLKCVPFVDSIGFDASIHQIFVTLGHGGALLITQDLQTLVRSPHFMRVTALGGTPSVISNLIESTALPKTLRIIMLGGEVVPNALIKRLRQVDHLRQVFNLYGPTETTIYSTVARLFDNRFANDAERERLQGRRIGSAVRNTRVLILNEIGQPVEDGVEGEITIYGDGVCRGYIDDMALTRKRFGEESLSASSIVRFYRTGDLGRQLPDGALHFTGRKDDQMKVNGVRFEPLEIERALEACPGIERAVVVMSASDDQRPQLVAYVIAQLNIDLASIRTLLEYKLPKPLIPSLILRVHDLPLSSHGKLDRQKIAEMVPLADMLRSKSPPCDEVERSLLVIWQKILRRSSLGVDEDFFSVGGDSLSAFTLVHDVEKFFDLRMPAEALENLSTVSAMAVYLRHALALPLNAPEHTDITFAKLRSFIAAW
jgi:UDP-N-acetylmuramate--L-alanine ligase